MKNLVRRILDISKVHRYESEDKDSNLGHTMQMKRLFASKVPFDASHVGFA
jgi:hypothetical protein